MLLKIFRGTGPHVILLIVIIFGALWAGAFFNNTGSESALFEVRPMPFYSILKSLAGNNQITGVIFSILLLSTMLFLLVYFNTSVFFINERTFFPAVVYLFLTSLFHQNQNLNPALPAAIFLIIAIIRIMDAYRKPGVAYNFFDAGVLISIGSLFYANAIWFGLLVIIGIAQLRTFNIREIAVGLIGMLTPYFITIGILYVSGQDITKFLTDLKFNLFGLEAGYEFSRLTIFVLIYSGLLILVSSGFLLMQLNSKKIKSRKTFSLLLWCFVISVIIYFLLPSVSVEIIWITGIPASYILVHYFVFARKKLVTDILIAVLFLMILVIQILNFL